jgi:nucleoside-diphosphate-sugar epimerase
MKVLILGDSGFIGSHLADTLVKPGHAVTIFHQPGASRKNVSQIEKEVRFPDGDSHYPDDIGKAVKECGMRSLFDEVGRMGYLVITTEFLVRLHTKGTMALAGATNISCRS